VSKGELGVASYLELKLHGKIHVFSNITTFV
jgi:hypothetical protein